MSQQSLTLYAYDAPDVEYRFDPLTGEHGVAPGEAVGNEPARSGFGATVLVGRWPRRSRVFVAVYLLEEGRRRPEDW